ncbi:MAG: hypothetical protein QM487_00735 [Candidatus Marithrix sp.]
MVKIIKENLRIFGCPPAVICEDKLLMTLMYFGKYRTEFHNFSHTLKYVLIATIYNIELKN